MRKVVYSLLSNSVAFTSLIPALRIYERSSVPDVPVLPFCVLAWGSRTRIATGCYQTSLEVWVHDERGDYTLIDDALAIVEDVLTSNAQATVGDERMAQADPPNTSPDLYDDTYRSSTRSAGYRLVGTAR